MNVRSFIDKYKWTIIISTIFVIIYIVTATLGITFGYFNNMPLYDFQFMIIIFLGGVFNEIINKRPRGFLYSLYIWIAIGLYQGVLFFVYMVGFYSYNIYMNNISIGVIFGVASFLLPAIIGLIIFYLLPANIVGGLIVFLTKRMQ